MFACLARACGSVHGADCLVSVVFLIAAAITAVKDSIQRWDSLTDVEQSSDTNIDMLHGGHPRICDQRRVEPKGVSVSRVEPKEV